MTVNRIPGGLLDATTEFFTVIEDSIQRAKCLFGGKLYCFQTTPRCRKDILRLEMKSNPAKERAMEDIVGTDEEMKLEQFTICNYGALNDEADIDVYGNLSEPEYVPCSKRSTCKHEGVGCNNIMVKEGVFLSKSEMHVFKLVTMDDDEIANSLFLSVHTVRTHLKNIRFKTGFEDKKDMIHWATIKGII